MEMHVYEHTLTVRGEWHVLEYLFLLGAIVSDAAATLIARLQYMQ
jgi:hypothetical protein